MAAKKKAAPKWERLVDGDRRVWRLGDSQIVMTYGGFGMQTGHLFIGDCIIWIVTKGGDESDASVELKVLQELQKKHSELKANPKEIERLALPASGKIPWSPKAIHQPSAQPQRRAASSASPSRTPARSRSKAYRTPRR